MTPTGQLRVAVTGAGGFVGQALVRRLCQEQSVACTAIYRSLSVLPPPSATIEVAGDLVGDLDFDRLFSGVDVVVHTAARVHVMRERAHDSLAAFRAVNVDASVKLASAAALAGVKRFIHLSSIKVNGESTMPGRPFTPDDVPAPSDAYAVSKFEAEEALKSVARRTGLELVIIRPPLVYGPGVKANFAALMKWVDRGVPLPLGGIDNRRTLVALPNLVDLIVSCLSGPDVAGQTLLAGDGEDVSTTELVARMARALDRPPRLFTIPKPLAGMAASLLGKGPALRRLHGNLQIDTSGARKAAGWAPRAMMNDVLRDMANLMRAAGR